MAVASLAELVERHGIGAKLVRAYCKQYGWRYTAQGAPAEWYAAWPQVARELASLRGPSGVKCRTCRTCNGRGWIDEECESGIAGISVPRHLRPICDDCDGKGYR